jgi:hypothetical protein
LLGLLASTTNGQDAEPPRLGDLTAAEYKGLEQITESRVAGTLSFLASDELEGRGTPSRGLDVATAYAASRLRAAGAEGLGEEGSFYLMSTIDTVRTPLAPQLLTIDGSNNLRTNLIEGGTQELTYEGPIVRATSAADGTYSGPVLLPISEADDTFPPPTRWLRREVLRLQQQGATAVLLEAGPQSSFWQFAESRQTSSRIDVARSRYPLPIGIVEAGKLGDSQVGHVLIPANTREASPVRNVAGVLRGSDPQLAEEAIVFTAHIDHLGTGAPGDDPIYNGADDDASGVTAILTLADAFATLTPRPKRSLIFVAFWGEEMGLLGSQHFVRNSPWPLEKMVANVNIEMIGRPEAGADNRMWMTGWEASDLGELIAMGSRRLAVETFNHPRLSAQLYRASDNFAFVQQGVIAHSFSAGSLHEDYHQPSDEFEKMNLPHMTQVIRGLYAGTLPIAEAVLTPQKPK